MQSSTSLPQTGISHSSWLSKRAEWRFAWDRRVVSLQGRLISYKEGPNKPDKKAGHVTSFQRECSTPYTFRVWVDVGETWTLKADDEETYQRWVGVLMRAVMADESDNSTAENGDPTHQKSGDITAPRKSLSASVMKRSYWTHTWRPRYLELGPRGCIIEYSEEVGGALRGRVNVVAVDPVAPSPLEDGSCGGGVREVAFQAQNGEGFHVRFESEEVAATWIIAFRERLGESRGCRWQALRVQKASGGAGFIMSAASSTSRSGHHGGTATDAALGRVAHCSFVEKDHLFVFGGRTAGGFSCADELIGTFNGIPSDTSVTTRPGVGGGASSSSLGDDDTPPSQLCSKDLFHVRLSGDFIANTTAVQPFEEAGRAKVRPVEREGAAGCVLGSHWVMQGGRTFTSGCGGILSDAWSIDLGALSSGVGLGWTRRTDESAQQVVSSEPQQSTPAIAFHTATPLSTNTILLCGGTADGINATDATWLYSPLSGSVQRGPPMPSARLQHSAVAIPSPTNTATTTHVLVVGGSTSVPGVSPTGGASSSSSTSGATSRVALPLMMLLDVVSGVWTSVRLDYPPNVKLPSFTYPSAALLPTTPHTTLQGSSLLGRVAIYGGSRSSRKLPVLLIADIRTGDCEVNADRHREDDNLDDGIEDVDVNGIDDVPVGDVDELPDSIASNAPYYSKRSKAIPIVAKIRPVQALGDSPTYACGVGLVVYGGYLYLVGGGGEGGVSLPRLMLNTI